MTDRISFAQFILNDCKTTGAFLSYGFMDNRYIARGSMLKQSDYVWDMLKEFTDRDDWLFDAGWDLLGYYAHITRGPDRLHFTVRGKEALALLKIQDKLIADEKARNKAAKNTYKQKELDAAWWP